MSDEQQPSGGNTPKLDVKSPGGQALIAYGLVAAGLVLPLLLVALTVFVRSGGMVRFSALLLIIGVAGGAFAFVKRKAWAGTIYQSHATRIVLTILVAIPLLIVLFLLNAIPFVKVVGFLLTLGYAFWQIVNLAGAYSDLSEGRATQPIDGISMMLLKTIGQEKLVEKFVKGMDDMGNSGGGDSGSNG